MNEAVLYILENNIEALKEYLSYNSINQIDDKGNTLLHYAIMYNKLEICYYLINSHIFLNQQNHLGMTPLFLAVHKNMQGVCNSLLKNNCDVSLRNDKGETPFYYSFLYGRTEIIKLFIEYRKADFTQKNEMGENILFALVRNGSLELLENYFNPQLASELDDANNNLLHLACSYDNVDIVKYLITKGIEINQLNKAKETPLFKAISNHNYGITKLLLQNGALTAFKNRNGILLKDYLQENFSGLLVYDLTAKERINYPLHYAVIMNDKVLFKEGINDYNLSTKDYFNHEVNELIKSLNYVHFNTIIREYNHNKTRLN